MARPDVIFSGVVLSELPAERAVYVPDRGPALPDTFAFMAREFADTYFSLDLRIAPHGALAADAETANPLMGPLPNETPNVFCIGGPDMRTDLCDYPPDQPLPPFAERRQAATDVPAADWPLLDAACCLSFSNGFSEATLRRLLMWNAVPVRPLLVGAIIVRLHVDEAGSERVGFACNFLRPTQLWAPDHATHLHPWSTAFAGHWRTDEARVAQATAEYEGCLAMSQNWTRTGHMHLEFFMRPQQ